MSTECFVPDCKNTIGVLFPKDPGLKKKWLRKLEIKNLMPSPSSFICLDHFEESVAKSTKDSSQATSPKKTRKVSFESTPRQSIETESENISSELEANSKNELENQFISESEQKPNSNSVDNCYENIALNEIQTDEGSSREGNIQENYENEKQNELFESQIEMTENSDTIVKNKEVEENTDDHNNIVCRLCTEESSDCVSIYENFDPKMPKMCLVDAILSCLRPLKIAKNDKLPKQICKRCLGKVKEYYQFWYACISMDEKQREMLGVEDSEDYTFTDSSDEENIENMQWSETVSPDLPEEEIVKEKIVHEQQTNIETSIETVRHVDKKTEIDKKFDMVEEQLRLVLEGQASEEEDEHPCTEKIIIDVVNDEEYNKNTVNEPITITTIPNTSNKNKRKLDIVGSTPRKSTRIKTGENIEISLPKGIKVKKGQKFESALGTYFASNISYLYSSKFCIADDYLYEYRLHKGNLRNLVCILPNCQGLAIQRRDDSGKFYNQISVQKPHNHKSLDPGEQKKQMFFSVLKHQMHIDKNLNFKSIYESMCGMDPEITELIPLRNVIHEICQHQLTAKIPTITTFEQLFDTFEDNIFNRLHFTHTNKQFYQDKFKSDDGSMAIVFANLDTIRKVSKSKLMYVDASFNIDNTDNFKYQLVTVLVWMDNSYYPIVFALVNRKTQEIYKQIFGYIYNTLAPKLRPYDIVTDYEANLYYALGETYVESNIGGSVFYFTQNLYKKVCSLNLARELETNSYFRNIYQMLLMVPLLPVNTIVDGLSNIEAQARDLGVSYLTNEIFEHIYEQWINTVTPELFCVHRLENRINENVIAPFKKFRDYIMLQKGKNQRKQTVLQIIEKLIELENFLNNKCLAPSSKKAFSRDVSSSQKKNVIKAWQYIESNPKINLNSFFSKVIGYIKCMENQLWIWGFYRFEGPFDEDLINANNFSIYNAEEDGENHPDWGYMEEEEEIHESDVTKEEEEMAGKRHERASVGNSENGAVVMEAVIDENGRFVLQNNNAAANQALKNGFFKYDSVK